MTTQTTVYEHRMTVQREQYGSMDEYGHRKVELSDLHDALPCRVFPKVMNTILDGNKIASITTYEAFVAYDADVKRLDRISSVTDRRGRSVLDGDADYMRILSVVPYLGYTKKLMLERIN